MSNEIVLTNLEKQLKNDNQLKSLCENKKFLINDYVACVLAQVQLNGLTDCTQESLLKCCIKSAQIGLKIDANGYAYLVAYENKKTNTRICNVIVGYKGYIALIKSNNPNVLSISCFVISKQDIKENRLIIKEGQYKRLEYTKNLEQDNDCLSENEIAGFVAIVYYKNGGYDYAYMTKKEVDRIKEMSNNYKYQKSKGKEKETIWHQHYVAMGKKTVFRKLVNWCDFSGLDKINELDNEDFTNDDETKNNTKSAQERFKAKAMAKYSNKAGNDEKKITNSTEDKTIQEAEKVENKTKYESLKDRIFSIKNDQEKLDKAKEYCSNCEDLTEEEKKDLTCLIDECLNQIAVKSFKG